MRTWMLLGAGTAALPGLGAVGLGAYVMVADPRHDEVPLPPIRASSDPEVIARGEYLVHAVAHCTECHGARPPGDHSPKSGRPQLTGGQPIVTPFGTFRPPNLTADPETGIGALSDGQIARAIRHGVGGDGRLSPFMKVAVAGMDDADLTAIVSYLRTVAPTRAEEAPSEPNLVGRALFAFGMFRPAFKEIPASAPPAEEPSVERGAYLARGPANCVGCHTEADPTDDFVFVVPEFSGGGPHPSEADPTLEYVPPNLTPAGPLGSWTEEAFVARFRAGRSFADTIMPWECYGQLTEADLRSIWRFLAALPPVDRDPGPPLRPAG